MDKNYYYYSFKPNSRVDTGQNLSHGPGRSNWVYKKKKLEIKVILFWQKNLSKIKSMVFFSSVLSWSNGSWINPSFWLG